MQRERLTLRKFDLTKGPNEGTVDERPAAETPAGRHVSIVERTEDVARLQTMEHATWPEQLTETIIVIESQLDEAAEIQDTTGEYVDRSSYRSAKSALKYKKLMLLQLQERRAAIRRQGEEVAQPAPPPGDRNSLAREAAAPLAVALTNALSSEAVDALVETLERVKIGGYITQFSVALLGLLQAHQGQQPGKSQRHEGPHRQLFHYAQRQ